MQNEQSKKPGARKQRAGKGRGEMLSAAEFGTAYRGDQFKRYIKAAFALRGLYEDTAIAGAVRMTRGAVSGWWHGARPDHEAIGEIAKATGLPRGELYDFIHHGGPPPMLPLSERLTPEDEEVRDRLLALDASPKPPRPEDAR
jgi:transcriptional regulator with XRE-family HTH domain